MLCREMVGFSGGFVVVYKARPSEKHCLPPIF